MFLFFALFVFIVEGIAQNIKHKIIMIISKVQLFLRKRLRKDHCAQIKRTSAVAESAASKKLFVAKATNSSSSPTDCTKLNLFLRTPSWCKCCQSPRRAKTIKFSLAKFLLTKNTFQIIYSLYSRYVTSQRVTSGGDHFCNLVPGQHRNFAEGVSH